MKRLGFVFTIFAALLAGAVGSYVIDELKPEDVEAQARPRANDAIRVAVVNLEEVSRQSRLFKERKIDWDRAQGEVASQNQKLEDEYRQAVEQVMRARLRGDGPDVIMPLQVEAKALEEAYKAGVQEGKSYLRALLNEYQKEVLEYVMDELRLFVNLSGYDVVFQDYSVDAEDAGFFEGGVYAQTLLSKSILYHPEAANRPNQYITDVTQVMIERVKSAPLRNIPPPPNNKKAAKDD